MMYIETPNCVGCPYIHPDNGNCTAVGGFCTAVPAAHCPLIPELRAELEASQAALAEQAKVAGGSVRTLFGVSLDRMQELAQAELEGRIVLRSAGAGRREVSSLRERLAAGGWIDPAVELPPDDDMVLAIVSGKPADNITLEDAYELASYGSEGWIVEQYELWETPTVTWWMPLPDPPEKKKEER